MTKAHSRNSVTEEQQSQGAKGQVKICKIFGAALSSNSIMITSQIHMDTRVQFSLHKLIRWLWRNGLSFMPWILMWAALNTGPWYFQNAKSAIDFIHAMRALFPFMALFLVLLNRQRHFVCFRSLGPVWLWMIYGILCSIASLFSKESITALYWATAYVAAILVLQKLLTRADVLQRITNLVLLNWSLIAVQVFILIVILREQLTAGDLVETIYGYYRPEHDIGGVAMVRSSGVARFVSVLGLVALARALSIKRITTLLWGLLFIACALIVYKLQSRGAIFAFIVAIAFICILQGIKIKIMLIIAAILIAVVCACDPQLQLELQEYITRGQSADMFMSMTGRTYTYGIAWELFTESPLIGFGGLADRVYLGLHVHNAYLHALLQSGIVGTIAFVGGWLISWGLLLQLLRHQNAIPSKHRQLVVETGSVLLFFGVRSIPECSGSYFGVDLLIILPIFAYLQIVYESFVAKKRSKHLLRQLPKNKIPTCLFFYPPALLLLSCRT